MIEILEIAARAFMLVYFGGQLLMLVYAGAVMVKAEFFDPKDRSQLRGKDAAEYDARHRR